MAGTVMDNFTPDKEEVAIDTSRIMKIGIIGAGWIAEEHVKAYQKCPDCKIVAVADLIPGKAEKFCERWGIEGANLYPDHKSMLEAEELDCVSVCTYNQQHAVCTIDALNKGINVLLEKPMTVTLEEAVEICKAEKASGKVLSIGFQPRFDANMQMIKKIVQSGELGQVYYIQTGGGRRFGIPNSTFIEKKTAGIGALGDIGCYSLDMVLNAIGYPKPLTVSGYTSSFFGTNPKYNTPEDAARFDVDDFAAAFIRLDGGIVLDFRISWAMHIDTPGDTIIMGTEAALRIPSTDCWNGSVGGPMKIYRTIGGAEIDFEVPLQGECDFEDLFYNKIRSFIDVCKYGGEAPVPSSQILYNQAIIDGIVKSAEIGKEIEINIPEI